MIMIILLFNMALFASLKELDHSSVEGDVSSATSTLFICLAPAERCIVQVLIPRETSSSFWKY